MFKNQTPTIETELERHTEREEWGRETFGLRLNSTISRKEKITR